MDYVFFLLQGDVRVCNGDMPYILLEIIFLLNVEASMVSEISKGTGMNFEFSMEKRICFSWVPCLMQQPASARGAETANCYIVKRTAFGRPYIRISPLLPDASRAREYKSHWNPEHISVKHN